MDVKDTSVTLKWNGQAGNRKMVRQWIRYTDEFGVKTLVEVGVNANQHALHGLTPGYTYDFEVIREYENGRKERGAKSAQLGGGQSGSNGSRCVVCHGDESNDECNKRALSCDTAQNQMCQTVVRVENGLAPRFEKRCKQRQACKNEEQIYKSTGICAGGTR